MKLSKVTLIILGVVILGAGFGLLYMMRSRQLNEQQELTSKLSANQAQVARLITERENWQAQLVKAQEQLDIKRHELEAAQADLATASAGWPRSDQSMSIPYDELMFKMAADWDLFLSVVTASEEANASVQGQPFQKTTFSVSLTGQPIAAGFDDPFKYQDYVYEVVDNILGFIETLAADENFGTATIDIVNINVPPMITDAAAIVDAGTDLEQPTSDITVTVFTRK